MSQISSPRILNRIVTSIPSLDFNIKERKFLLFFVDVALFFANLYIYYAFAVPNFSVQQLAESNFIGPFYGLVVFYSLSLIFNLYNLEYAHKTRKIVPLVAFISIIFSFVFVFTPVITPNLPDRRFMIFALFFGLTVSLILWRVFYAHFIHTSVFFKNVIILASEDFDESFISKARVKLEGAKGENGYKVMRVYSIPTDKKSKISFSAMIDRLVDRHIVNDIVILDRNHENISELINRSLVRAIEQGVDVQTYMKIYEEINEAIPLNLAGRQFYSLFPVSRQNSNYLYQLWSKFVDVCAAFVGLILLLIISPMVALVNLFFNRGPLFYSQKRVGKGGKEYTLTKFRSMVVNAETKGAKMATKGDARVTAFGKILRKSRIDELPQFWAVLVGDMSLIGPRPERMVFVNQLTEQIPFYNARHTIKPGITGWAQVKYPYGENFEDSYNKLEYDLYYIKNRSVTIDLRIVFKTVNSVIFSKGQ